MVERVVKNSTNIVHTTAQTSLLRTLIRVYDATSLIAAKT